jgi:peptidoglycan/LPS O-acetylase OafA/YrhL
MRRGLGRDRLALWLTPAQRVRRPQPEATLIITGAGWTGLALLVAVFALGSANDPPADEVAALLASGLIVTSLVAGTTPGGLGRILASRLAVHIGRRSYGLYLWHYVILSFVAALHAPHTGALPSSGGSNHIISAGVLVAEVALSFVVAELSYRFIEVPALRLKRRFQPVTLVSQDALAS